MTNSTSSPALSTTSTSPKYWRVDTISKVKFQAIARRKGLRQRQKTSSTIDEQEEEELSPNVIPPVSAITKQTVQEIATKDVDWKATLSGDLATFMYPSLQLESLYDTSSEVRKRSHHPSKLTTINSHKMPSTEQVTTLLNSQPNLKWQVEKRYQITSQSTPENDHRRMTEEEFKRLQFDKQLEAAEGLLRKKEQVLLETKRQQGFISTSPRHGKSLNKSHDLENEKEIENGVGLGRSRGASLYTPEVINSPQLIPRLPHTRKYVLYSLSFD